MLSLWICPGLKSGDVTYICMVRVLLRVLQLSLDESLPATPDLGHQGVITAITIFIGDRIYSCH